MKNILKILRKNWILVVILCTGLFLRAFKPLELFHYSHDQDLIGWFVRDVLVNHHIRLIGQETSSHGVFIGPLFYYLLIPFYMVARMDPAGSVVLPIILGTFSVFSFYYVFATIFNKKVGLIAATVYAISSLIVLTDREVVPTMPAMLLGIWFLFSLFQIFKGKQKYYLLIGLLFGLVWNVNLALIILSPLVVLSQILSGKKINIKFISLGLLVFVALMSPYFVFEARHNFQQTNSVVASLTTQKDYIPGTSNGFLPKLDRVMQLVNKNTTSIFFGNVLPVPSNLAFLILIAAFAYLTFKRKITAKWALVMFSWLLIYVLFFSFNSLNLSEYYLNGMNIIWIAVFATGVEFLLSSKKAKIVGYLFVASFVTLNLVTFFNMDINRNGYVERKAITKFIQDDALAHGYPCVSVSYISSPGNELGYRYFYVLEGLHVNQSKSGSPVYTIVFPLSMVSGVDKTFGVLGLVLPDYQRYTKEAVEVSCSGQDANLTDPLFGFTK